MAVRSFSAFVVRNHRSVKAAVVLGLAVATIIAMALGVDGTALAGGGTGGTYCPGC